MLAIGPTATVLAYDLYKLGYQAIDIGHIDIEYEWFLMKAENKVVVKNKYVAEVPKGDKVGNENSKEYLKQIICKIPR